MPGRSGSSSRTGRDSSPKWRRASSASPSKASASSRSICRFAARAAIIDAALRNIGTTAGGAEHATGRTIFAVGELVSGVYEITGLLGEGGMGQVFEAIDRMLHRRVAIKA